MHAEFNIASLVLLSAERNIVRNVYFFGLIELCSSAAIFSVTLNVPAKSTITSHLQPASVRSSVAYVGAFIARRRRRVTQCRIVTVDVKCLSVSNFARLAISRTDSDVVSHNEITYLQL